MSPRIVHKKSDYYSESAERIYTTFVTNKDQGYYGLPTPMEVAQDVII